MQERLFKDILPRVARPVRYMGDELNMIKKEWDASGIKMAFAFPDVYEIGMSHLGGKILYGLVNERSVHLMERTYAPWPDMEELMRKEDIPLYTLESFRPLQDFDLVGFSLQYELSITNILNMLDLAHIPLRSWERTEKDPLVIAGGPVAFNPEPFADFFDAFLLGDGEELILEFMDFLQEHKGWERKELLRQAASIQGVYVPSLYRINYNEDGTIKAMTPVFPGVPERVRKRIVADLDTAYFPEKPIVPYMNIVHDRASLEVMRGCQRACRFCHAGIVYRPVRERSVATLKKQAARQLQNTGYEEISLASLSTLDYSGVKRLVMDLVNDYGGEGIGVSLPSLRVDAFSVDLVKEVQKVRKTTLTLAPEAGTQRLRDVINKNVSEDELYRAVEDAFKAGWLSIKLYFMIGLPTETEEDLDGILEMLRRVKSIGNRFAPRPVEVRASLASFVPKAHTPFQWQDQDSIDRIKEKQSYLLARKTRQIKLSFHDSKTSFLEGIFARGDRRLAQVIYQAWQSGCKFDGWSDFFSFERWLEAFQKCQVDPGFYVSRNRSYDEIFPWDFIDVGVSKSYLQAENEKAFKGETTPDCRHQGCVGCGICSTFGVEVDIRGEG